MQVLVVALNPERGEEECAITINALLHNPKLGQAGATLASNLFRNGCSSAVTTCTYCCHLGSPRRKNILFFKKWDEMYYGCIFGGLTSLSYTSYLISEMSWNFYGWKSLTLWNFFSFCQHFMKLYLRNKGQGFPPPSCVYSSNNQICVLTFPGCMPPTPLLLLGSVITPIAPDKQSTQTWKVFIRQK